MTYHSYTEGDGPFHIWGERGHGQAVAVHRNRHAGRPAMSFNGQKFGPLRPEECEVLRMPEGADAVYTDRLQEWDQEKYATQAKLHLAQGNYWLQTPETLSAFLTGYLGKPVRTVALWQFNNASSGYPVWLIFFRPVSTAPASAPGEE